MTRIKKDQESRPSVPKRQYTEAELQDFHNKIQRFYKDKTQTNGEVLSILDFNELAVAYGAFVKRPGSGGKDYYLRAAHDGIGLTRYEQLNNLMNQYEWWRQTGESKKDAAIQHQLAHWEKTAESVETDDNF